MKREKRSNKLLQRLGSLLLALALVLGMTAGGPSMKAKADTPVVHPTGGKAAPTEVEFTEEELAQIDAEWEAVEKNTCTVSKAAADYWKSFGTDYYYNKLSATEKALWDDIFSTAPRR